jgi:hypothetical protein
VYTSSLPVEIITDFVQNTIHTTISGVYGSWYFNPNSMPKGATRGAFKRAVTYSFGSISLGSLLVAIIQFLRQLCSAAQRNAAGDGNMVGAVLFCIVGCLISILEVSNGNKMLRGYPASTQMYSTNLATVGG